MNSFLIVTPFRNAERFIAQCAARTLAQLHGDFRVVFIDDASTDNGPRLLSETISDRPDTLCRDVRVVTNAQPVGALENLHRAIMDYAKPQDIVAVVDGDDWLLHRDVLAVVDDFYNSSDCWMSYGGAVWKPEDLQTFEAAEYSDSDLSNLRVPWSEGYMGLFGRWRVQHLRTFRAALYRAIETFDPAWSCLRDERGRFWATAADVAAMLPMLELAGGSRIHVSRTKLYVYNQHDRNDHAAGRPAQADTTRRIFALPSFPRLESIDIPASARCGAPAFARPATAAVGRGIHLSGWPVARANLERVRTVHPVVLDDFVEQTFCYGEPPRPYRRPWVGIFHHPPNLPLFAFRAHRPQAMFRMRAWAESLPWLVGGIALSEYHAAFLRESLPVPVAVVKHPVGEPSSTWSREAFRSGPRRLLQVGFYARNTRAIHQVPPVDGFERARLLAPHAWIAWYDGEVRRHWQGNRDRREYDGVIEAGHAEAHEYERLLSSSVVLTEVFDASANNVVVECLVRETPIAVNRHPAVAEYLGEDYPLFFDDIREVPQLLKDSTVLAAHEHLRDRDKSALSGECFVAAVEAAIDSFCPAGEDRAVAAARRTPGAAEEVLR